VTMAATVNIDTFVGDDVSRIITFVEADKTTPINITGRTYVAQIFTEDGTVAASMTATVPTGTDGKVNLSLARATTTTLGVGNWRWSLVETASGVVTTVLVGGFTISSEATS
jgi:hypothetical protein